MRTKATTALAAAMFPITARTAPRIVVPNPDPSTVAPLFVKESEASKQPLDQHSNQPER
jgi:hypothetical protein